MYLYDDKAVAHAKEKGSLKDYYGERYIDYILLDIDKGQNSDEQTLRNTQHIAHTLSDELGLETTSFRVYYSGTGYFTDFSTDAGVEIQTQWYICEQDSIVLHIPLIIRLINIKFHLDIVNYWNVPLMIL